MPTGEERVGKGILYMAVNPLDLANDPTQRKGMLVNRLRSLCRSIWGDPHEGWGLAGLWGLIKDLSKGLLLVPIAIAAAYLLYLVLSYYKAIIWKVGDVIVRLVGMN